MQEFLNRLRRVTYDVTKTNSDAANETILSYTIACPAIMDAINSSFCAMVYAKDWPACSAKVIVR